MSILESIGNTPLVELQHLDSEFPNVKILAKLEGNNPGGSVKDRPALFMIREAIREAQRIAQPPEDNQHEQSSAA